MMEHPASPKNHRYSFRRQEEPRGNVEDWVDWLGGNDDEQGTSWMQLNKRHLKKDPMEEFPGEKNTVG